MHSGLLRTISQSPAILRATSALSSGNAPLLFIGAQGYAKVVSAACLLQDSSRPAFVVFSNPEDAVTASRDLTDLLGSQRVVLFPAREVMPFETHGNQEMLWMRISCMERLLRDQGPKPLVVMPATALFRRVMPANVFRSGIRTFQTGMQARPEEIVRNLVSMGYQRDYSVEARGQIALRGGILDVFPPSAETPYRLEFAFDEIESIRTFDPENQVSLTSVDSLTVTPATDAITKDEHEVQPSADELSVQDTILSYVSSGMLVVDDLTRCVESLEEFEKIGAEIASARIVAGTMGRKEARVYLPAGFVAGLLRKGHVYFSLLPRAAGVTFKEVVETDTSIQAGFSGRWHDLQAELADLISKKRRVVILAGNKDRRDLLERWLARLDLPSVCTDSISDPPPEGAITLALGSGGNGFNCDPVSLSVFTETEVYGRPLIRQRRIKKSKVPIDWRQLSPGDYVVHANHGIGQFMGIKTMTVNGITRDYLYIRYAGTDALYVPVDQVDLIEKYVGPEGTPPTLQKLGTGDWQKIKARVKASVEDMARKLLTLEAKRKSRQGYAFGPDTPWQRQFEDSFDYEETEDQIRATEEIKRDMEKPVPMDRLLCGDVGFGKTEVAMRCAFKAVMESKQVAVLVPTTILAEQHYNTFIRRFADFPVSIQALSRFRSSAEQRKIVKDLAAGAVDIVIGTHRLLSKDIKFKDLGLLIVDEEHRFGVAQKERLKEMAENCDVLTLTATPIPRTLNMALSGIRDISVIETPPEGRFPVETYVVPANPSLIAQAIRREIRRGGQVFYVHNRVYSISRVYQRVKALVPEARIIVGHGKMKETDLSRVMQEFLQGRYDVLISTTIIESGLDLPNVNTLIVEDADKLGLAQLYQLRGRVGRSNRIAYAYFTYRHDRSMTFVAEERLNALRDFSTMGSGFKLAMRDMEIRGAGNLLGAEQHGFMTLVGYDMYLNLLEKAVRSLRGEKEQKQERILTQVDLPSDAYIPESYIDNPKERFAFYKRIAASDDLESISEIEAEIQDRFGVMPSEVENLLDIARIRIMAGKLGITQVALNKQDLTMGRHEITLKIEVPHLFPTERLQGLFRAYPALEMDTRLNTLNLTLSKPKEDPLITSQRLLERLSQSE